MINVLQCLSEMDQTPPSEWDKVWERFPVSHIHDDQQVVQAWGTIVLKYDRPDLFRLMWEEKRYQPHLRPRLPYLVWGMVTNGHMDELKDFLGHTGKTAVITPELLTQASPVQTWQYFQLHFTRKDPKMWEGFSLLLEEFKSIPSYMHKFLGLISPSQNAHPNPSLTAACAKVVGAKELVKYHAKGNHHHLNEIMKHAEPEDIPDILEMFDPNTRINFQALCQRDNIQPLGSMLSKHVLQHHVSSKPSSSPPRKL